VILFIRKSGVLYLSCFSLLLYSMFTGAWAADWPQWRGPQRNGASAETGLLKKWPEKGPSLIWSVEKLGGGHSSASVSGGKIFITGIIKDQETLTSLDLNGKILWQTPCGEKWKGSYPESRSTPTVEKDRVYVISGMGEVFCIDSNEGKINWSRNVFKEFDGDYPGWGIAESPLIVEDKIICTPGGEDASLVALDKMSGKVIWQTKELSEQGNYCSPILIKRGAKKIIATQLADSFVGIDAENGKVLWRDEYEDYQDDPKDININSPLYHDGHIYITSGYDNPGAMFELSADGTSLKRLWTDNVLDVHLGGVVFVDGYIYGSNWEDNRHGNWVCLDWKSGKVMWETKWKNKGPIITAEGMLYCYEEKNGGLALVRANPQKLDLISSFEIPLGKGPHWSHPAISDGRLYVRHGDALMVYDIKSK
jgi:outer membrane protein assembly factor BamB